MRVAIASRQDQGPLPDAENGSIDPSSTPFFGVVLFDGGEPGPGWACLAGRNPERISSPHDLGTSALWLTNLPFEVMRDSNLSRNPWLRNSSFLRLTVDQIVAEWGLKGAPQDQAAAWLSDIFGRVMRITSALMPGIGWKEGSLAGDLATAWPLPEEPHSEHVEALRQALQESLQEWTATPLRPPRGNVLIKLWRPRVEHFLDIMASPVPVGAWDVLKDADMPQSPVERMKFLIGPSQEHPILARVSVPQHASEEGADIFAFAHSASNVRRGWCSQPELLMMQSALKPTVEIVFRANAYGHLPDPQVDRAVFEKLISPIGASSWSAGLVLENLWLAATRPAPLKNEKGKTKGAKGERRVHARGVWLRANDRVMMYIKASEMSQRGWIVTGYGGGALWVSVPPHDIRSMLIDAYRAGLEPALQSVQDVPAIRDLVFDLGNVEWGGHPNSMVEALSRCSARGDRLADLDALPDIDQIAAIKLFKAIMEEEGYQ